MIVPAAIWVKCCLAERATVAAGQILIDGHFILTNTAKNGFYIKFRFIPNFRFMICFFLMTGITGKVFIAALEFYCNYIE
jgi:K+ transporter